MDVVFGDVDDFSSKVSICRQFDYKTGRKQIQMIQIIEFLLVSAGSTAKKDVGLPADLFNSNDEFHQMQSRTPRHQSSQVKLQMDETNWTDRLIILIIRHYRNSF